MLVLVTISPCMTEPRNIFAGLTPGCGSSSNIGNCQWYSSNWNWMTLPAEYYDTASGSLFSYGHHSSQWVQFKHLAFTFRYQAAYVAALKVYASRGVVSPVSWELAWDAGDVVATTSDWVQVGFEFGYAVTAVKLQWIMNTTGEVSFDQLFLWGLYSGTAVVLRCRETKFWASSVMEEGGVGQSNPPAQSPASASSATCRLPSCTSSPHMRLNLRRSNRFATRVSCAHVHCA